MITHLLNLKNASKSKGILVSDKWYCFDHLYLIYPQIKTGVCWHVWVPGVLNDSLVG